MFVFTNNLVPYVKVGTNGKDSLQNYLKKISFRGKTCAAVFADFL